MLRYTAHIAVLHILEEYVDIVMAEQLRAVIIPVQLREQIPISLSGQYVDVIHISETTVLRTAMPLKLIIYQA